MARTSVVTRGLLLTAALLAAAVAWADGEGAATSGSGQASAEAEAPKPVVRIDITETIEGRPYRAGYATYYVRKKLRELGFRAWSSRVLKVFEREHDKAVAAAKAAGQPAPEFLEETKPKPDLVIRGEVRAELERTSTFYGQDLAFVYNTQVVLSILDAEGKELQAIRFGDEFGRRDRKLARRDVMRRAGLFAAAEVLASKPIRAAMSEAQRSASEAWIAKINAKRKDGDK